MAIVVLAVAAAGGVVSFFNARDDATTGGSGLAGAPGRAATTPAGLEDVLRRGNVVIEYPSGAPGAPPPPALARLARDVAGPPSELPALRRAGQAVELRAAGGRERIVAYAWQRRLDVSDPADPRLRGFVEHWLGRGGQ